MGDRTYPGSHNKETYHGSQTEEGSSSHRRATGPVHGATQPPGRVAALSHEWPRRFLADSS